MQLLQDFLFPWQEVLHINTQRLSSVERGHLAHYRTEQSYLLSPGQAAARNGRR